MSWPPLWPTLPTIYPRRTPAKVRLFNGVTGHKAVDGVSTGHPKKGKLFNGMLRDLSKDKALHWVATGHPAKVSLFIVLS